MADTNYQFSFFIDTRKSRDPNFGDGGGLGGLGGGVVWSVFGMSLYDDFSQNGGYFSIMIMIMI